MAQLDAHEKPPETFRLFYKTLQKATAQELSNSSQVIDSQKIKALPLSALTEVSSFNIEHLACFADPSTTQSSPILRSAIPVFSHCDAPGLLIYPQLFSPALQTSILDRLFHRDLSNPIHQTNVHKHYVLPYRNGSHPRSGNSSAWSDGSFFALDKTSSIFLEPLDPDIHKPLSVERFLNRKLRWLTLGGQYDWTAKLYPEESPPAFPPDLVKLLKSAFPHIEPEAAIVNLYSPNDTLSLHRDVSEECSQDLISISFGCEAIFVVACESESGLHEPIAIRLRSGDAVIMGGVSRFAWHGVPQILPGTCPNYLQNWPDMGTSEHPGPYASWRGFMAGKRVNFNVRQMF